MEPKLEKVVQGLLSAARKQWPEAWVGDQAFTAHVTSLADEAALPNLKAEDLYLALAAVRGEADALRAFDVVLVDAARSSLLRQGAQEHQVDEVVQKVREKLLVPPSKLATYGGRGTLKSWLRATCVRTYLNTLRGPAKTDDAEQVFERLADTADDPELAHLRETYRDAFKQAFTDATATLSDRDKNLLRYFYVDGLSLDEIAKLHDTSRATAHRWLARARAELADTAQRLLAKSLGAGHETLRSIRRLVLSDIEVTLQRLL